jgi:site-specific recombinase XerD
MAKMHPVCMPRTLPVVLSPGEVRRLIEAAGNLKHQTALSVAYGAGLRASEVVALKISVFAAVVDAGTFAERFSLDDLIGAAFWSFNGRKTFS